MDVFQGNRCTAGLRSRGTVAAIGRTQRGSTCKNGLGVSLRARKGRAARLCHGLHVVQDGRVRRRPTRSGETQKLVKTDDRATNNTGHRSCDRAVELYAQRGGGGISKYRKCV